MPIKIPDTLPARKQLEKENIFVMSDKRAYTQDIRPIKIAILNLMPTKIETETQLLRLLGNSPLQVEIELIQTATYTSKNTPSEHLLNFYKTFDEIKNYKFDGLIITGAPVEDMEFEKVAYWDELTKIMEWSKTNVCSTFHICWGAQAGLYYHYGINKKQLDKKAFGVFKHKVLNRKNKLVCGFDDEFLAPHSRHTTVTEEDIKKVSDLEILAISDMVGPYIISDKRGKNIFITGHSEYDRLTLANEYFRDVEKGIDIDMPYNYFPDNNPNNKPTLSWRSHSNNLYLNWLNYFVYQITPYDLENL